ncbi:MAG TPA: DNA mismatch repair endonuclease MutL [Lachnospiraceae bacterium]|nr:DNA mismatch repair endonuclease MutL [Lachnospiraceae bacterium]
MNEINVLDGSTINQIAAGEVVERPVSVVKELIENAIDSLAKAITVEINEGGIEFIRVTDNGCGIEKNQVAKAFLRHATSKIKTADDLSNVNSLGFRGEALSSISSVGKVEMITKTKNELTGIRLLIEGTKDMEIEEIGAPEGTTMIVRNLFFNTPVRRNFLKTVATETSYISDLVEKIAMSKPQISFKYVVNGKTKFHTSGNGDLKEVIYRIYGREVVKNSIPIHATSDGITVYGFIGDQSVTRGNRNYENYFINSRYIKSDIIAKAIESGCSSFLMQHHYPFCVLHFIMDTEKVDVNVHPTKMDVRFSNQNQVYEFIIKSIEDTFSRKERIPEVTLTGKNELNGDESLETPKQLQTQHIESKQKTEKIKIPEPFEQNRIISNMVEESNNYGERTSEMQEFFQFNSNPKVLGNDKGLAMPKNDNIHANIIKSKDHILVEKHVQMNLFEEKILSKEARDQYKILGQLFDTYWIIGFQDKVLFVDQHAAHEKVKYEMLLKKIKNNKITSQILNPPIVVTLSSKEETVFKQYFEEIHSLGFEIEEFGGNEFTIRGVPSDLYGCNEKQLFIEMIDEMMEGPIKGTPNIILEKLASMSCKAAVKGNNTLSKEEASQLIDQLLELDNPYHCPHGRPTIVSMSKYEMEKKFKRII